MIISLMLMGMRTATLAIKFALTLFIAQYMGLAVLGSYGLISAAIALFATLGDLSLLYTIAREAVTLSEQALCGQLKRYGQYLLIVAGLALLFALSAAFVANDVPYALLIIALLYFEMINVTFYGLLINLSRPILASLLHFIRSGLWAIFFMTLAYFYPEYRTITILLCMWVLSSVVTIIVLALALIKLPWGQAEAIGSFKSWFVIRWHRSKAAFKLSVVSTISNNATQLTLGTLLSLEIVGVYVFFYQAFSALSNIVQIGFIQIFRPELIRLTEGPVKKMHRIIRQKLSQVISLAIGLAILTYPTYYLLTNALNKAEVIEHFWLFSLVLLAFVVNMVNGVLDALLYSYSRDDLLLKIAFIFFACNLGLKIPLILGLGLTGAIIADLSCLGIMFFVRRSYILHTCKLSIP